MERAVLRWKRRPSSRFDFVLLFLALCASLLSRTHAGSEDANTTRPRYLLMAYVSKGEVSVLVSLVS